MSETLAGAVLRIYANLALGFFVDAGLVGEPVHVSRWVRVDLRVTTETYHGLTTAHLEAILKVRLGDTVSLHLRQDRSRSLEISTAPKVAAVASDTPTIATVAQDP